MATVPFPFDTFGAKKILTDAEFEDKKAEAVIKVIFMVVTESMVEKREMKKFGSRIRVATVIIAAIGVVIAGLRFLLPYLLP